MTEHRVLALAVLLVCGIMAGCNARETPAAAEERRRDFIRLDPSSPRLNYIKVEVAEEADVAPSVQLTGRVAFDEDIRSGWRRRSTDGSRRSWSSSAKR